MNRPSRPRLAVVTVLAATVAALGFAPQPNGALERVAAGPGDAPDPAVSSTAEQGLAAASKGTGHAQQDQDHEPHDAKAESLLGSEPAPAVEARRLPSIECEGGQAGPFPCSNVDLESFVSLAELGGGTGNDIWGWTDPETGREYALMGTSNGAGYGAAGVASVSKS